VILNIKMLQRQFRRVINYSMLSVSVSACLHSRRNDCSEVFALSNDSRVFQARAAATKKAWSATAVQCVRSTISVNIAADRRQRQNSTLVDFWVSQWGTVCDTVPLRQQYIRADNGNWILELTTSVVDGGVGLCVLTSLPRTSIELQHQGLTAFAAVWLEDQPVQSYSSPKSTLLNSDCSSPESGEGQLGDPTPPGWPLWRTT